MMKARHLPVKSIGRHTGLGLGTIIGKLLRQGPGAGTIRMKDGSALGLPWPLLHPSADAYKLYEKGTTIITTIIYERIKEVSSFTKTL